MGVWWSCYLKQVGYNRENDLVGYIFCFRIMEAQYLMFQFYVGREDSVGM
jgi:hypothetical protein